MVKQYLKSVFHGSSRSHPSLLTPERHLRNLWNGKVPDFPAIGIMGFYPNLVHRIKKDHETRSLRIMKIHECVIFNFKGISVSYMYPGLGAPSTALCLEQIIAMGARVVLFFGPAAGLRHSLKRGELVVPRKLWIEEGTSRHYSRLAFSRPHPLIQSCIAETLKKREQPYRLGDGCSMDAPYRETLPWISQFRRKRCLTVDMESSAVCTIAGYRNIPAGGFFSIADRFDGDQWVAKPDAVQLPPAPIEMLHWAAEAAIQGIQALEDS